MLNYKPLVILIMTLGTAVALSSCSKDSTKSSTTKDKDLITVDNGEDPPSLDTAIAQDSTSARILYDLFEGLTSFDQNLKAIPGLAEKWEISADDKVYNAN